ncbi:unnamed protein product, partial [Symbiodinium sp. CCMP2456]
PSSSQRKKTAVMQLRLSSSMATARASLRSTELAAAISFATVAPEEATPWN